MNLTQYKALFFVLTVVLALFVASPVLQRVLVFPRNEFFTEFSLLGPGHMAEHYPYNITRSENYNVFLEISNKLGSCAYYQVEVKFRNETESATDNFRETPSALPSLYNLKVFVADQESLEIPVSFSVDYSFRNVTRIVFNNVTVSGGPGQNSTFSQVAANVPLMQVNSNSLKFNGENLNLQGYSSDWNPLTRVFYGNLVFELWIYNSTISSFQYHNRSLDLKLNLTSPLGGTFVG
jgi:hypothetical protein